MGTGEKEQLSERQKRDKVEVKEQERDRDVTTQTSTENMQNMVLPHHDLYTASVHVSIISYPTISIQYSTRLNIFTNRTDLTPPNLTRYTYISSQNKQMTHEEMSSKFSVLQTNNRIIKYIKNKNKNSLLTHMSL